MAWRHAPVLGCRDVRAAAHWFRDVLGFHLDPETGVIDGVEADEGAIYAVLTRADAMVHLQIRRRDPFGGTREDIESDAYFYVEDADALLAEFRERGARVLREPMDEPYGLRDFVIETPEGHRLLFGSPV